MACTTPEIRYDLPYREAIAAVVTARVAVLAARARHRSACTIHVRPFGMRVATSLHRQIVALFNLSHATWDYRTRKGHGTVAIARTYHIDHDAIPALVAMRDDLLLRYASPSDAIWPYVCLARVSRQRGLPTAYRADLWLHDYNAVLHRDRHTPFVWALRDYGTHLYHVHKDATDVGAWIRATAAVWPDTVWYFYDPHDRALHACTIRVHTQRPIAPDTALLLMARQERGDPCWVTVHPSPDPVSRTGGVHA